MSLSPVSTTLETNKDVKKEAFEFSINIETVKKTKEEKMEKIKVEELKESAKETGEENERIKKQKAREVKNAAASAEENEEEKDKIKKQKARETKKEAVKRRKLKKLSEIISDTEEEIGFEVFIDVVEEKTAKEEEISEKIRKCEKLMRKYADETAKMKRESDKESHNYEKVEANLVGEIGKLKNMRERIVKGKISEEVAQIAKNEKGEGIAEIAKREKKGETDQVANREKDERNDKIAKQKAREVTDAEASAKKDDKIMKQKAREVTDAEASAEKDDEKEEINLKYEETSQKLVSEAQYGKELKDEFEGIKNAVASMKAKHKVDIDLKNTKIEELKEQIKTSEAEEKLAIVKMAEKANSLTLQGVASARNPPCGITTPSDGGKICKKKTVKDTKNSDENDQRFGANEDETGADNVENTEKVTDGEKEPVGIKVMEALEENFETHPEKINKLVYGHTNDDYVKEDIIEEKVTLEWSKKISKKHFSKDTAIEFHEKAVLLVKWFKEAEEEDIMIVKFGNNSMVSSNEDELGDKIMQPREKFESQTGVAYDINNQYRLGYSEVQLMQELIEEVNMLYKEDLELQPLPQDGNESFGVTKNINYMRLCISYDPGGTFSLYEQGFGVSTFLYSKKYFVMEHDFYAGIALTIVLGGFIKNVGPGWAKAINKSMDGNGTKDMIRGVVIAKQFEFNGESYSLKKHKEKLPYNQEYNAINILENMLQTLKSAPFFVMDETDTALDNTVELYNETKLLRQFDPGISGDWSCSGLNFNPAVGNEGLVANYVKAALGHARSWSAGEV